MSAGPRCEFPSFRISVATTSSLEALKAASLGNPTLHEKGTAATVPFYQHAIELDPNFAGAHLYLGKMYLNVGERGGPRNCSAKPIRCVLMPASGKYRINLRFVGVELYFDNLE